MLQRWFADRGRRTCVATVVLAVALAGCKTGEDEADAGGGPDAGGGSVDAAAPSDAPPAGQDAVLPPGGDAQPQGGADASGGPDAAGGDVGAPPEEAAGPFFYFVLHADPAAPDATTSSVPMRFNRLKQFMQDLEARGAGHHVTVMLTGPWIDWLADHPDAWAVFEDWMAAGHQVAFHSHTRNHTFRDGYTNAEAVFGPDDYDVCWRADTSECTLDAALATLGGLMPPGQTVTFAALGPHGNGAGYWGLNDGSCNPEIVGGVEQADEDACVQAEWVGELAATIHATSGAYPDLTPDNVTQSGAIRGTSRCVTWGEALEPIYYLPHAAYETEASKTAVSYETVDAALDEAGPGDFIGIVVHPVSYTSKPAYDAIERVNLLLDSVETHGLRSRTLDEVRQADTVGDGVACR
jgi:hypothetical protein